MNNPLVKKFIPIMVLFVVINLLLLIFKDGLNARGMQLNFVFVANVILFLLSSFGFFIQTKSANSTNINAFIRGIYSSLLMKMFVIVAAIFIYIFVTGGEVNKAAIFASMAIYLLYTSIEVVQLMKIGRKKPNG
jgi:hypothetical protein